MEDKTFDELLESVKEMDNTIMNANELRYRFEKLADEFSNSYVLKALLAMMSQAELKEYYDYFNQLHPGVYDEDGNHI